MENLEFTGYISDKKAIKIASILPNWLVYMESRTELGGIVNSQQNIKSQKENEPQANYNCPQLEGLRHIKEDEEIGN